VKRSPKCDACRKGGELRAVTIALSLEFDGPFRHRSYVYLCGDCRESIDTYDEMIGPTLAGSLCSMIRLMRKGR